MRRLVVVATPLALALVGPGTMVLAPAVAQGVAPGGSIANTTGIGSGLATQGGTSPSSPNGTTQPTLAPPPPPGGGAPFAAPPAIARPSTVTPPSYSYETRPRKPAVVPLNLPQEPDANLSFLKGCWRTDVFQHAQQNGLATWCFSGSSDGKVLYTRINQPDFFCHGPAEARYAGGGLQLHSAGLACNDGSQVSVGDLDCRQNGTEGVQCNGSVPMATFSESWSVRLYRVR